MKGWSRVVQMPFVQLFRMVLSITCLARRERSKHNIIPVSRNLGPYLILALPSPVEYDARPYRCTTCDHASRK
eukprot:7768327-Karenia_brevis.AAC.1